MFRLLRDLIPATVLALLVSEIILITSCFVVAAFLVLQVDPSVFLLYDGGLGRIAVAVFTMVAALYLHDLYSQFRVRSRILLVQQGLQVVGIAFIGQALLSYGNPNWILPRWLMMLGSGFSLVAIVAWRIFYAGVVLRAFGEQRVLFLGTSSLVGEIADHLTEHPEYGMSVAGFVEEEAMSAGGNRLNSPVLGDISSLRAIVEQTRPDRIIVGMKERRGRLPVQDLLELRFSGIRIEEAATAYEAACRRVSLKELRPAQLIFTGELGPQPTHVVIQSLYSGVIGLGGVVISLPIMLLVALAVKLSSPGPVLLRQQRVGQHGKPFVLYKFRSMYADAEARTGAVWASKNDPRVTPVGRWLRRLRLDELPQFFNVLHGEMAIVGPRPERPEFVRTLTEQIPFYRQRHFVKPGITGWAQINHEYGDSIEDTIKKLEYDLYYIKNLSPALDAYIIFHTLKTMLLRRGAH